MSDLDTALIDAIRAASRKMVRELGFMRTTLAGTEYSPSAVHAMMEIGTRQSLTAAELAEFLNLEKSTISRMVRKLIEAGELKETVSRGDARAKLLSLTPRGKRTVAAIHAFGRQQVTNALAKLSLEQQQAVVAGLTAYAQALEDHRVDMPKAP
ncbi:MarR family winged helix-turn-helix transcriptional regulator [Pandoraea pneumonica]